MSTEILLLGILIGMTLLGYMVAINSHGPTKLSISYLLATVLLAGTVWAIVNYVNAGQNNERLAEISKLERERQDAESRANSQEQMMLKNKNSMEAVTKINKIISTGTGYASNMMNVDLKNFSYELDVLMGRANVMIKNVAELTNEFEGLRKEISYFQATIPTINDALENLAEAAKYYRLYFRAEDTAQEELRLRALRSKARNAYESFKKAGSKISSSM